MLPSTSADVTGWRALRSDAASTAQSRFYLGGETKNSVREARADRPGGLSTGLLSRIGAGVVVSALGEPSATRIC